MRVVVDDQKTKLVEIDADHDAMRSRREPSGASNGDVTGALLRKG
jgi:hypothetical protein